MRKKDFSKREKILKIAKELFYEKGFRNVTTDDIAKKASVGKGTIYRYFDSKEDILIQLAKELMDDIAQSIYEAMKKENFNQFIEDMVERIIKDIEVNSKILFLFHREIKSSEYKYDVILKNYKETLIKAYKRYKNEIKLAEDEFYYTINHHIAVSFMMSNTFSKEKLEKVLKRTLVCILSK